MKKEIVNAIEIQNVTKSFKVYFDKARTLKEHSQEELDKLINKIIQDRLDDNQLSDSPLTLKDIKVIAQTLSRVLRSVFHKRIKYQESVDEIQEKDN